MTRSAFLFKLLAAVGIGQGLPPNVAYKQCLREGPGHKATARSRASSTYRPR